MIASALVPLTQRLRFLVAVRPGLSEPAFAARMAATLDRLSEGRLLINVVTGGDPVELKGDGVFLDHDERYEATDKFLSIWRKLIQGEEVTETHKHLRIERGKLLYPPHQKPYPPLYFGGSSGAGGAVAAKHVDVYLTWGEPPAEVAQKIAAAKALGATQDRAFSFGIRLHVIVRETSADAWRAAEDLIAKVDDDTIATAQKAFARFDSVGQQRIARLHGGRRDKLEVAPNLRAGVGLVRGGAGTALVGQSGRGRGKDEGVHGARHRPLHPLRISASRGMLPLRRTGVPKAPAQGDNRQRSWTGEERGSVRRDHRECRRPVGTQGGGGLRIAREFRESSIATS